MSEASEQRLLIRPAQFDDIATIQCLGVEADARYRDARHPELADRSTIPTDVVERAIAAASLQVACIDGGTKGTDFTSSVVTTGLSPSQRSVPRSRLMASLGPPACTCV